MAWEFSNSKTRKKSVFPSRYSKIFKDYWMTKKALTKALMSRIAEEKDVLILVSGKTGCQPAGSKVLMSDGLWKNIENIKVGDEIISPQHDGTNKFSKIIWTTSWDSPKNYDVIQTNKNNKKLYSCSSNHTIPFYHFKKDWNFKELTAESTEKLSDSSLSHSYIGFSSFPIEKFKERLNCEIEPYSLGIYLGDGTFTKSLRISSDDKIVIDEIKKHYSLMSIYDKKNTTCKSYNFSILGNFSNKLKKYNLYNKRSKDKFIPKEALLSDLNYRKRLLAGLIDSDGYFGRGGYEYTSKSKKLIGDIQELVYSVGGRTGEIREVIKGIKKNNFKGKYYSISFYLGNIKIPILTTRRQRKIKTFYKNPNRIAIKVTPSKPQKVYGFTVDSPSHWYITDNWMITKNSGKSHFTGNLCWRIFSKIENPVKKDGTPMFEDKENFIIDPDEFAYKMLTKEGQVLWLDEARRVANRRKWYSKINNAVADRKNQNRKLFNIYFLCMPFEKEFDPVLASHLTIWFWVRRRVVEIYCARSDVKGGDGLNIRAILDREKKWMKENPNRNLIPPTIHPEFIGRMAFPKLSSGLERRYKKLAKIKSATGDLTEEEKKKYGIVIEKTPEDVVLDAIDKIKKGEVQDKTQLWNLLDEIKDTTDRKVRLLDFYLKMKDLPTFAKIFDKSKVIKSRSIKLD